MEGNMVRRKLMNLEEVKLEEDDKAWYSVGIQQIFIFLFLTFLSLDLFHHHHHLPLQVVYIYQ